MTIDRLLEQKFRIEVNMNRRHLTLFQRIELQYKLETIENEIGKAATRMFCAGKVGADKRWAMKTDNESTPHNNDNRVVQNYTTPLNQLERIDTTLTSTSIEQRDNTDKNLHSRGRVIDISARRAQVSPMTYFKGREIIKNAPEDIKDQLRKGKVKIDKVYRQLQKEQKRQELINAEPILEFPMMGSGTTGAGALKLKRRFIGIEIDSDKFQIASSRLLKINE